MRTPLLVVTGVEPVPMDATLMSLAWDLPQAVVVRHRIDPESQILTRIVSDVTGLVESAQTHLEHACVSCALREDIIPTLERLARDDRWRTIVAGLPTATEADQLVHVLAHDTRLARHLRLSGILATLSGDGAVQALLSDDLLRDRGVHTSPDDDRGVGEVACAQIELADAVVVLDGCLGTDATDLVRALGRPDIPVLTGVDQLDAQAMTARRHQVAVSRAWCSPDSDVPLPALGAGRAWRLELTSERPFHPDRLLDNIERLGTGPHRSRGAFWVPTRRGDLLEWSGAGGQLSIGRYSPWGRRRPRTRLVFTGLGTPPRDLTSAFEDTLLTAAESPLDERRWDVLEDGLEAWIGDIRDVA